MAAERGPRTAGAQFPDRGSAVRGARERSSRSAERNPQSAARRPQIKSLQSFERQSGTVPDFTGRWGVEWSRAESPGRVGAGVRTRHRLAG